MEDVNVFILIVAIIGWITAIVITYQCYRWRKRHDEAVEMWEQESKIKTDKIVDLQAKLENDERYNRVIKIEQVQLQPRELECTFSTLPRFVDDTEMFKKIVISEAARYLAEELERDPYLCKMYHGYNAFDGSEKIKVRFRMLPYAEGVIWDDIFKEEENEN